ncbi:hypothetical protein J5N97_001748 [Dioscorea zingiberensis]|uniref:PX domain-containing protein n=1 Tax=Dioscorea zingiberensis TaxID=325984 RepID=A0A9D5H243_9LILI|nr:hypothetical protein J5N97_001748 [Dioscorea zingiberensis]
MISTVIADYTITSNSNNPSEFDRVFVLFGSRRASRGLHLKAQDPLHLHWSHFISYRVITETNFPEYQAPEKIVIRRYNDFVWLRDRLTEKFKGIFISPLLEMSIF